MTVLGGICYLCCCSVLECGTHQLVFLLFCSPSRLLTTDKAFLPSSFAMYTTTLACSYSFRLPSISNNRRTLAATLAFATGAILGWPFSLLVSIPFIFEELFVYGLDRVPPELYRKWLRKRLTRLFSCGLVASIIFVSSKFVRHHIL